MPKLKPLKSADFERMTKLVGQFVSRLGATVAEFERASRRAQTVNGAANGSRRRRRHPPIDRAAVLRVVGIIGKKGVAAGKVADRLHVDVGRVRPVLWQLRDAGQLRMTGKLSLARYHLADSSASKAAQGSRSPASKNASSKRLHAKAHASKRTPPKK